ncbi:unnamed protein product [Mytilus edulis]|uniref:SWIM-type domain-containing protein n=1 Tax=Mytilus edulis TaxID=6550 RepID=A0A8S3R1Z8_MYTED|nr:unnamed protein product [Mytilus edulis]
MASLSVEEENYVRMSLLLTGISPRAARTFFDSEFAPACLEATIKKEYNKLLDLKKKHRINQSQWNLLCPRFPGPIPPFRKMVVLNNLQRGTVQWKPIQDSDIPFPQLTDEQLRSLTCGVYQLKLSPSYIQEYMEGDSQICFHKDAPDLLRIRIQSRHVSSKKYFVWIKYSESEVNSWYCTCRAGARVVGVCAHITSIIWYLSSARNAGTTLYGELDSNDPPLSGFDRLPSAIDTTPAADLARIKHYRNHLAHLDDGKLDTGFFNTAWNDITCAIDRLGGQQMKQECDHLKTKPLDQTNQEIIMDIKHSNNEIRELKESFKSLKLSHTKMMKSHELLQEHHEKVKKSHETLQEDHRKVTNEMKVMKTIQMDTVPLNIRGKQLKDMWVHLLN